MGFVN
jgi:class 3 adenylate cyclase